MPICMHCGTNHNNSPIGWINVECVKELWGNGKPQPLPTRLRALADNHMEQIAAEVHNQWWREKEKQDFHPPTHCQYWPLPHGEEESRDAAFNKHCEKCHPDMYPYEELPEHIKEYDRVTVRGVLSALEQIAAELENETK